MRVPNPERAVIAETKLRDYLLSDSHPVGRYKAAFFKAAGYSIDTVGDFEAALRAVLGNEVSEVIENDYGTKYVVRGRLRSLKGDEKTIVTVWIILLGKNTPRFVTAYPEDVRND